MTLTVKTPHGPVDAAALDSAERQLGIRLPDEYRAFLATIGGGHTGDVEVPLTGGMGVLQELFDLHRLAQHNREPRRSSGFLASVPRFYVQIGRGSGGCLCLRKAEGEEGSIWWADFDQAGEFDDEDVHDEIMVRLADDFAAFLELFD